MEHKHFVTFEQSFISISCYETELHYHFLSKNQLSILRIDHKLMGGGKKETETILFSSKANYTDEIDILKTFLIELFSHSGNCFGYPIFSHSELITEIEFDQLLKKGINNIDKRKSNTKQNGQDHPLIIYCAENNLYPEPEDHSPYSWKANCPSGRQHHIMFSTSSYSWGCGYYCKNGGLEELKGWIAKK